MKKIFFFSQILNQKICLLSINSVQATIQEKSIDTFMAAGWGGGDVRGWLFKTETNVPQPSPR